MRNRSSTFPEYSAVRVVKLRHADRWTEGGVPSVGDEGTVVGVDERDDGVCYTVEHAPGGGTKWIADFSQDELEWISGPEASAPGPYPVE